MGVNDQSTVGGTVRGRPRDRSPTARIAGGPTGWRVRAPLRGRCGRSAGPDHAARPARTRHSAGPAGPGSGGTPGRGTSARTARSGSRERSRSAGRGDSRHTGQVAGLRRRAPRRQTSRWPRIAPRRGGEGGIRTHEVFRLSAFQERRHQPLGHLSGDKDIAPPSGPPPGFSRCRGSAGRLTTTVPPIRSIQPRRRLSTKIQMKPR